MPLDRSSSILGLSYVSRQLDCETRSRFYVDNTFEFETVGGLNVSLRSIGSPGTALRRVRVTGKKAFLYSRPLATFRNIACMVDLQSISID